MPSIREEILQRFSRNDGRGERDEDLQDALYALLYTIDLENTSVDGWNYFRVTRESSDSLNAVGLMTLLPSGSVPIEISVRGGDGSFSWSVKVGRLDPSWLALSESKQWNRTYLYATGEREIPQWDWDREFHGLVHQADGQRQPVTPVACARAAPACLCR